MQNTNDSILPLGDQHYGRFYGQDILSITQFSRNDLDYIFRVADAMRTVVTHVGSLDMLKGKVLANLFYEPSTRTSSSFIAAMERLGGSVIPISEVRYSSVAKGESLSDTVRTLECYADVIVLRHPDLGAAVKAAHASSKPIINAGDGVGEHPTQALLDLFTIQQELGYIDGATVTMVGDLKHGRTVHSLSKLLSLFNVTVNYVSPEKIRMPEALKNELNNTGLVQYEHESIEAVIGETDVLYVTRVQKERFENLDEYDQIKNSYVITPALMEKAKKSCALMHPLPRVGEISEEVDADPRAAYFRQMKCGLYIRMALLAMVLGKA